MAPALNETQPATKDGPPGGMRDGESALQAFAQLRADHLEHSSHMGRIVDRTTALIGSATFLVMLSVLILVWAAANIGASQMGYNSLDAPPFSWLSSVVSLLALYVAILILATQRRADQLGSRRGELALELGILNEKKSAKIIELLEELRRDSPDIHNRVDRQATAMATPADTRAVLTVINDSDEQSVTAHVR